MKPFDPPSVKQKEEKEEKEVEESASSATMPSTFDPASIESQEFSNHDDYEIWDEDSNEWDEDSNEWDSDHAFFYNFVDLDSKESQMKFKELEEQERRHRGLPPRPLSPFDPAARPRRRPLNPSWWWLENWLEYIDLCHRKWDRQRNTTSSEFDIQINPLTNVRPASILDFSSEEFQMKFKEEDRRRQGLSLRSLSPINSITLSRQRP